RAWQETAVLFNQSYHMTDMYVEGPDAEKLLNSLGINSFKGFEVDKAKQYVPCNHEGYVIGDVILFYLDKGKYNVTCTRDERTADQKGPTVRKVYRYQVQGPNAMKIIEKAIGKTPPDLKFFNMTHLQMGKHQVRALRHGMA